MRRVSTDVSFAGRCDEHGSIRGGHLNGRFRAGGRGRSVYLRGHASGFGGRPARIGAMRKASLVVVGVCLLACGANAQVTTTQAADPTARTTTRPATTQAGDKGDKLVVTEHELKLADRTLRYTATAGTLAQKDEGGAVKA